MTPALVLSAGLALGRRSAIGAAALVVVMTAPPVIFPAAAVTGLVWLVRGARRRRMAVSRHEGDLVALAELASVGLTAGHDFITSLDLAGRRIGGEIDHEVRGVVRRARTLGAVATLESWDGVIAPLCRVAVGGLHRGAPLGAVVEGFVLDRTSAGHSAELERLRKLPIRLLFPLALMVLPGFLVLLVAPAIAAAVERLGF